METISLKALANKVLLGNKHGNTMEISENTHGNIVETSDGNILENMRCAVLLWSEVLQAHLWVTVSKDDVKTLRERGITEPIYSGDEIRNLKLANKDELRSIHRVKEVFENAEINSDSKKGK